MKQTLLVLALWALPGMAKPIESVTVDIWSGKARIAAGSARIDLAAEPLSLTLFSGGDARVSGPAGEMFSFRAEGKINRFAKAITLRRLFNGVKADLLAEDGSRGELLITMTPQQHIVIRLAPLRTGVEATQIVLTQKPVEHFYGLGDLWDTNSVDAKGSRVVMWVHEGTPDVCNYVPFFMSTAGYGVFADTSYRGYIDFGKTDPSRTEMSFEAPELSMNVWLGDADSS